MLRVVGVKSECVGALHKLAHSPDSAEIEVVVENHDVGVLAFVEGAFAVVDTHDLRGGFGGHTHGILEWYVGLLHESADEAVHCGDAAGEGRAVGELADTVFDNHTGVECSGIFGACTCEGIGDDAGAFHTLHLVDETQYGGGHMDAVGHDLYGHVVDEVDALYGAFIFVFAALVEAGHGVVEVCGVGIA